MRLLVYPHDLIIGGSQINAIDLAAGVAEAGHEVIVYGIPGPLIDYITKRGLRFIPAKRLRYRPAPSRIAQLAMIARDERIDLIHAYEWPPCLDAYFGAGLIRRVPIICTVLGMAVPPYVPSSVPLIMGTAELGDIARQTHRAPVWVLEPPIDTAQDHPAIDGTAFRRQYGITSTEKLVVSVSRLAIDLKLDALVRAIDAVGSLAGRFPVRLVLVGDGAARLSLAQRAARVNNQWGREVVTLAGPLFDPREAYAAADVVVGMGSSSIRALAIGRPVIVQGARGYSEIFSPETLSTFLHQGFFGVGANDDGASRLGAQLEVLLKDPEYAERLGQYGHSVVADRLSLRRAIPLQQAIYDEALGGRWTSSADEVISSARRALTLELSNHNPIKKRRHADLETRLLAAARDGRWPPP